ncbi:hypothetical protein CAPTEDRAFT_187066 [Capitella teleta]|uniref:Uncharacterized protein n=1 Tax=Capitella teleta TaxID=283909 RepID=R7TYE0_CAPTE|nr:hypothetical protein CAPTEDRAFT_187066 [Capitella teleta]|eukprot:ELT98918.1 hypothetical protein CAPTEDRAFT_187066 [Capitella teleta]
MNDDDLEEWRKHSCILVVNLEYPDNVHDLHNELPLAPERLMINKIHSSPCKPQTIFGFGFKINKNTQQNAKNPFEKLMNNSVFDKKVRILSSKINFEKATILNKPVYLGMSILDISKTLMFDMHYNFIKKKFDASLLFTDTDSLAYEVKIDNIKRDMYTKYDDLFDTSNYPANSKYHNEKIRLSLKKTCKGIKTNVIKHDITFNNYLTCLKTRKEKMHELYSERLNKIALSANDDKRHICEDGVNTLAYGHYSIRK